MKSLSLSSNAVWYYQNDNRYYQNDNRYYQNDNRVLSF